MTNMPCHIGSFPCDRFVSPLSFSSTDLSTILKATTRQLFHERKNKKRLLRLQTVPDTAASETDVLKSWPCSALASIASGKICYFPRYCHTDSVLSIRCMLA